MKKANRIKFDPENFGGELDTEELALAMEPVLKQQMKKYIKSVERAATEQLNLLIREDGTGFDLSGGADDVGTIKFALFYVGEGENEIVYETTLDEQVGHLTSDLALGYDSFDDDELCSLTDDAERLAKEFERQAEKLRAAVAKHRK